MLDSGKVDFVAPDILPENICPAESVEQDVSDKKRNAPTQ